LRVGAAVAAAARPASTTPSPAEQAAADLEEHRMVRALAASRSEAEKAAAQKAKKDDAQLAAALKVRGPGPPVPRERDGAGCQGWATGGGEGVEKTEESVANKKRLGREGKGKRGGENNVSGLDWWRVWGLRSSRECCQERTQRMAIPLLRLFLSTVVTCRVRLFYAGLYYA
jgi:hypothetical protein